MRTRGGASHESWERDEASLILGWASFLWKILSEKSVWKERTERLSSQFSFGAYIQWNITQP